MKNQVAAATARFNSKTIKMIQAPSKVAILSENWTENNSILL
jgi:hypothetical protein